MDRNSIIGYVLIFLIFAGFYYINGKNEADLEKINQTSDTTVLVESTNEVPTITATEADSVESIDTGNVEQIKEVVEQIEYLENDVIKVGITNKGGRIASVLLKEYVRYDSSDLVLFEKDQSNFGFEVPLRNGSFYSDELDYTVRSSSDTSLIFESNQEGIKVVHRYVLSEGYQLKYGFALENSDNQLSRKNPYIVLNWGQTIQGQEKSIDKERDFSNIYYKYKGGSDPDDLGATGEQSEELKTDLQWVSFKQKFFNSTLMFNNATTDDGTELEIEEPEDDAFSEYVEKHRAEIPFEIAQTATPAYSFSFYFGPNHYQTLKSLDNSMEDIIPLGWGVLSWVNIYVVIPVFNWLSQFLSNYGLIILIMTIIIKLILFLPMYKVYVSTAKMRLLKPELDELKERVGGDMAKMQQEQMKLYKQAGVSPLGGCLPQLVQLPILIALFRFFPASIELRQESLWWADDLSTYDSVLDLGFSIPFYGDHVSLFTLLMTVVTLLYTYMNSQISGASNNPSMKVVMYMMPIMFLGFFNNYAAALSFYYLLSTSITIIQNLVIRKFIIDEDKLHRQIQENKKKKIKVKKNSLVQRLEKNAKKRGIDPYTGKKK